MGFHLRVRQNKHIYFLLFFSCFSFKSLPANEKGNSFLFSKSNANDLVIDRNYFRTQADASYLKSEMAYYDRQTVQAIDYLKEAILQAPQSLHLRSRLADIYKEEKLFAEAAKQYQILIEQSNDKEFRYKLAEIYLLRGIHKEVLKNYKNLTNNKYFPIAFQRARLFMSEKSWFLALKALSQIWRNAITKKEKGNILLAKAYIYEQLRYKSHQEKVFKQFLSLNLSEEDFLLKVVQFYIASKKLEKAEALLLQYQKKDRTSIEITKVLFALYLSLDNTNKAHKQIHHLEKLGSLDDTHHFFIVSFLLSEKKYVEAIPFIKDLVQKHPLTDYYRYLLGAAYEQNQEWKKSLDEYKQIKKLSPYFVSAQIQMGQIWKDQGQIKKALNALEKVIFSSRDIKEFKPFLIYAQYLWEEGQEGLAISVLTKGENIFPENTDILFLRGLYFGESGKTELALKDMEKILEIDNSHGEALNFIAYTYAEKKQELDRAETLALKSLTLNPSSSYFLDTLGWVFFQKGNYKKALFYLIKAFSRNKKDIHIVEHLGETYYKLKNFKKCEYFFKQALELEKNEQKRSQIKKRLVFLQSYL